MFKHQKAPFRSQLRTDLMFTSVIYKSELDYVPEEKELLCSCFLFKEEMYFH